MTALCLLLASVFLIASASAKTNTVPASMVAETETPAAGQVVTLAIVFKPEPGWHGYWINPGDAGQGLSLQWSLPSGVTAGVPRFPVPETLVIAGIMNHVYEHDHAVLVDVAIPANMTPGTRIPVKLEADWLGCTDKVCVPQKGEMTLELVTGDGRIDSAKRTEFDRWRAALPRPLGSEGAFAVSGDQLRIAIPYPAAAELDDPHVFLKTNGMIDYASPQSFFRQGDMLVMEGKAKADAARDRKSVV